MSNSLLKTPVLSKDKIHQIHDKDCFYPWKVLAKKGLPKGPKWPEKNIPENIFRKFQIFALFDFSPVLYWIFL